MSDKSRLEIRRLLTSPFFLKQPENPKREENAVNRLTCIRQLTLELDEVPSPAPPVNSQSSSMRPRQARGNKVLIPTT